MSHCLDGITVEYSTRKLDRLVIAAISGVEGYLVNFPNGTEQTDEVMKVLLTIKKMCSASETVNISGTLVEIVNRWATLEN